MNTGHGMDRNVSWQGVDVYSPEPDQSRASLLTGDGDGVGIIVTVDADTEKNVTGRLDTVVVVKGAVVDGRRGAVTKVTADVLKFLPRVGAPIVADTDWPE